MIKTAARIMDAFSKPKVAHAHCDIPCGIYDPHLAQVAAHSVVRMVQLIEELQKEHEGHKEGGHHDHSKMQQHVHHMARYTKVKEEHAELVKHEVRIIWGDYFKPEMLEKHKGVHELVWKIMKAASSARQTTGMTAAEELLQLVQKFAEIFWETKGKKTRKVAAPYPTGKELVVPEL